MCKPILCRTAFAAFLQCLIIQLLLHKQQLQVGRVAVRTRAAGRWPTWTLSGLVGEPGSEGILPHLPALIQGELAAIPRLGEWARRTKSLIHLDRARALGTFVQESTLLNKL